MSNDTFKIILLDYHETPTSSAQAEQVLEDVKRKLNPEYISVPLGIEVRRIPVEDVTHPTGHQVVHLVDQAGLTPDEWRQLPVIPRLPDNPRVAVPLWREISERRGYVYPIVRGKPRNADEAAVWAQVESVEDVADALAFSSCVSWSVAMQPVSLPAAP